MNKLTTAILVLLTASLGASAAYADHAGRGYDTGDLLQGIATALLLGESAQHGYPDPSQRYRDSRRHRHENNLPARGFRDKHSSHNGIRGSSFTSEPIRGGSSRRTRIIENPYPNRAITGISFTGIERDAVHINDVITYPRKRLISHSGYSLSLYHPSQFLSTRGYVDYVSVKAKRKEYFTVTFHYD